MKTENIYLIQSVKSDFTGKNWIATTYDGEAFIIPKHHGVHPEVGGVLTVTTSNGEITEMLHNMRKIF